MNTATLSPADDHPAMIHDCEQRESKLSEWEAGFIDSISRQIGQGKVLSFKQTQNLDEIWERVTA